MKLEDFNPIHYSTEIISATKRWSLIIFLTKKSYSKILITWFHLLFNSSTYKHKNIDQTCYWSNADHWSSTWEHRNRARLILLHPQTPFFPWPHLAVCRILVPQPEVKPMPPALGAQHLTTESPRKFLHTDPAPHPNPSL